MSRVTLNVGGRRYVTFLSTLRNFPDTFLGTMFSDSNFALAKSDDSGEYFFDRNGDAFSVILEYYRNGGKIMLPVSWELYSPEMLYAELDYFQIPFDNDKLRVQTFTDRANPWEFLYPMARQLPTASRYLYLDTDRLVAARACSIMETYGDPLLSIIWFSIQLDQRTNRYSTNLEIILIFAKAGPRTLSSFQLSGSINLWPVERGSLLPTEFEQMRDLDWTALHLFMNLVPSTDPQDAKYLYAMEWQKLSRAKSVFVNSLMRAAFDINIEQKGLLYISFLNPTMLKMNIPNWRQLTSATIV